MYSFICLYLTYFHMFEDLLITYLLLYHCVAQSATGVGCAYAPPVGPGLIVWGGQGIIVDPTCMGPGPPCPYCMACIWGGWVMEGGGPEPAPAHPSLGGFRPSRTSISYLC